MTLRLGVLLLLLLGACGGPRKSTIPVDSPLRPFVPPEEPAPEEPPPQPSETTPAPEPPPGR
jgi:hypothetical protein